MARTAPTINGKTAPRWLMARFEAHLLDSYTIGQLEALDLPAVFGQWLADEYGSPVRGEHKDGSDRHFALPRTE